MQALVRLALAMLAFMPAQSTITLEVRTFDRTADISEATRVVVHPGGRRDQPVGQISAGPRRTVTVGPGIYDVQVIREQSGRVVNIRWAERLIVMRYPDEDGHHVEVVNFQSGYGALEVRGATGRRADADVTIFIAGEHNRQAATATTTSTYTLFVVRAGEYDVHVTRDGRDTWHRRIDVPLDRTRLWIVPEIRGSRGRGVAGSRDHQFVGSPVRQFASSPVRQFAGSQTTRLPLIRRKTMMISAMTSRM
jgi:hypothetical protein